MTRQLSYPLQNTLYDIHLSWWHWVCFKSSKHVIVKRKNCFYWQLMNTYFNLFWREHERFHKCFFYFDKGLETVFIRQVNQIFVLWSKYNSGLKICSIFRMIKLIGHIHQNIFEFSILRISSNRKIFLEITTLDGIKYMRVKTQNWA